MIPSTKENKTITKNQFYQLLGLCLASVKFEEKLGYDKISIKKSGK